MKLEQHLSPNRLAVLGLGASLLPFAEACWLAWPFRAPLHIRHTPAPLAAFLIGFFVPLAAGLWATNACASALRRGTDEALWPAPVLEALGTRLNATLLSILVYTLALCGVGMAVTDLLAASPHTNPGGGLTYFFVSPLIALASLRKALVPRPANHVSIWQDMKPVLSELWGKGRPQT